MFHEYLGLGLHVVKHALYAGVIQLSHRLLVCQTHPIPALLRHNSSFVTQIITPERVKNAIERRARTVLFLPENAYIRNN